MNSYNTTYSHASIWPQIYQELHNRYEILDWLDILKDSLDINPRSLYYRLLPYRDAHFDHNQRLIIYHRDTDYYYSQNSPGFFIQNLYVIMQFLNIPSEYVIMLCAYPDMSEESNKLAQKCNIPPIKTIYCPYQWCPGPEMVEDIDINLCKIFSPFICLNSVPRVHRSYTLCVLKHNDIFEKGLISWMGSSYRATEPTVQSFPDQSFPIMLSLCKCDNPTRINETLILKTHQWKIMNQWHHTLAPYKSNQISGKANEDKSRYSADFLQYALWNIVLETVGEYPHAFMTEKTVKAILTKRPFVILGGRRPIENLKKLGFQTFDRWIDESYDNLETVADRIDFCILQIKQFCDLSPTQLKIVGQNMESVLEYNFNHYINEFGKKSLDDLIMNKL